MDWNVDWNVDWYSFSLVSICFFCSSTCCDSIYYENRRSTIIRVWRREAVFDCNLADNSFISDSCFCKTGSIFEKQFVGFISFCCFVYRSKEKKKKYQLLQRITKILIRIQNGLRKRLIVNLICNFCIRLQQRMVSLLFFH